MGNKPEPNLVKKQIKKVTIYHDVFKNHPSGKEVLKDMMKVHHCMQTSFRDENSHITAFNEGQRNVVMRILTILETNPREYLKLLEEANRDE